MSDTLRDRQCVADLKTRIADILDVMFFYGNPSTDQRPHRLSLITAERLIKQLPELGGK